MYVHTQTVAESSFYHFNFLACMPLYLYVLFVDDRFLITWKEESDSISVKFAPIEGVAKCIMS